MKTAYELAMERLGKISPGVKLTSAQKRQLADLDARHRAKIAERELAMVDQVATAAAAGDSEKVAKLEQELVEERKKLQAELDEKKEQIRQAKS